MTETGGSTLEAIRILVALLAAAALAGVAVRWLRIPYSVALVVIGLRRRRRCSRRARSR